MSTIPLVDTALINEQDDPYDLVDPSDTNDPVPFHASDTISIGLRAVTIPSGPNDPEYLAGDMSISFEVLLNAMGRSIGQTVPWVPDLPVYGSETYRGIEYPANKITFEGSVFLANTTETSPTFDERTLNLSRFTMDTDPELLELTGSADAPMLVGKAVLRYKTIRPFFIPLQQSLPNERLSSDSEYNVAVCNGSITSELVLSIKRYWNGGVTTIGTITFDPLTPSSDTWVYGAFVFNDTSNGPSAATLLYCPADEMFVVEATTVPVDFEWVSVTLLGIFKKYVDPSYNIGV